MFKCFEKERRISPLRSAGDTTISPSLWCFEKRKMNFLQILSKENSFFQIWEYRKQKQKNQVWTSRERRMFFKFEIPGKEVGF